MILHRDFPSRLAYQSTVVYVGIRLKLSSYNLFTFNPSYNYFNFLLFS